MAAKVGVLWLILSSNPYLRSAMVRFPFWHQRDTFWPLQNLWCDLHMFLDILEFKVVNKNHSFFLRKMFWKFASYICETVAYLSTKLLWKCANSKKKLKSKNHESIKNLWRIPWDQISSSSGFLRPHF